MGMTFMDMTKPNAIGSRASMKNFCHLMKKNGILEQKTRRRCYSYGK